jgi:hypothetical protein
MGFMPHATCFSLLLIAYSIKLVAYGMGFMPLATCFSLLLIAYSLKLIAQKLQLIAQNLPLPLPERYKKAGSACTDPASKTRGKISR